MGWALCHAELVLERLLCLSVHAVQDPEGHRKDFVAHKGKETIKIQRDEFKKGSRDNDWVPVLDEFVEKIGGYVGKATVQCLSAEFSTSGPHLPAPHDPASALASGLSLSRAIPASTVTVPMHHAGVKERAVAAVTLMDTVQHYFEYRVVTRCGFPSITLTGMTPYLSTASRSCVG